MQSTKRKKFKRGIAAIGTAIVSFAMAASMAFSACAVSMDKPEKGKTLTDAPMTAAAQNTNSLRFVVSNAADFETMWNAAVNTSKTKNKQVWFVLDAAWEAPTSPANHPFGADSDGFSYGRITVPTGADIVLDLNGHTINRGLTTYTQLGSNLYVAGGKLTIEDSAGGGTITGGWTGEQNNWHPTYPKEDYGGGIMMNGGELTINGGNITGNKGDCAAGIYVLDGKFVMNGGSITNNIADRNGGGIEIEDTSSTHEINGGVISGNYANGTATSHGGGGVRLDGNATLVMTGGTITGNHSTNNGGGVFLSTGSEITVNGGEISHNNADKYEGAICMMNNTKAALNGGVITQNTQATGCAVNPGSDSSVSIGGPVKIYDNFTGGAQANIRVPKASFLEITGPLVTEKGSPFIGITTSIGNNGTLTKNLKTNGKVNDFTEDFATYFFADNANSLHVTGNSGNTEVLIRSGKTVYLDIDWQYQVDNGGTWKPVNDSSNDQTVGSTEIDLIYGQKVTAIQALIPALKDGSTDYVACDWYDGGTSTTTDKFAIYSSPSGASANTPFASIANAGLYTIALDTNQSYWDDIADAGLNSGSIVILFPSTLTVSIQPKDVKINITAKSSEYGDKLATLAAEIDGSTPLVGADASLGVSSFVSLSTEATNSSDLGTYTIKGAVKSTASASIKNNYKFIFNTATYTVSQATITVKLKGSNTYNGSAQNPAFSNLEIAYPNGTAFAGTKLTSSDVTITPPTGGCISAKEYDKDDISISLGTTASAQRFKFADTDPVSGDYEIKKAKLTCTADAKSIGVGDAAPTYTVTYTGFVGTDTKDTVITTDATCTCPYTTTSAKGEYTITPSGAAADNYEFEYKTGKLTVGAGAIAKPTIALASGMSGTYDGTEQTFNVTGYNATAISSVVLDNTNFVWNAGDSTIKVTKAGKCKVKFTLDTSKYTWTGGSMAAEEIEIELKPMPLVFSLTQTDPDGDSATDWKWAYGATGTIDYSVTTTTVATDTVKYYYHYYPTGDTSKATLVSGTSIDVSTVASGNYTAEVRLVASTEAGYSADNANYTIDSNSKNTQAFKIDAGDADTSGIVWQYKLNGNPATNFFDNDGNQVDLKYGLQSNGNPNEIEVQFPDISSVTYLTRDTTRLTQGMKVVKIESDNSETEISGGVCTLPGKYKITVALVSDEDHLFDNNTKYGEISEEFEIAKAEVNLSNLKIECGWYDDDAGDVVYGDYNPGNLPVYRDSWVYIRVKGGTDYPEGITKAEIVNETTDYIGDRDKPGTVSVRVKFTLDPNYVYIDGGTTYDTTFNKTVSITLSKQKIPVSWVLDTIKDGDGKDVLDDNGLPYQIYVLDFSANPDLEQYVKYEYYYADMTDPANPVVDSIVPATLSGTTNNAQLDHLIDVDKAGKFNGGTSTLTKDIFIRPVLDTTVTGSDNYVLDIPAGGADQYTRLGLKKNAVTVEQVEKEIVYGTEITNFDTLYTLKQGNSTYAASKYTAKIYKDSDSTNAVLVKDFDFATAGVGTYTIKFELTAAFANSDALSKTSITFEITRQEIEVPGIIKKFEYNNGTQYFKDLLDGKYQEYLDKGIIGPVSGNSSGADAKKYVATLEIINPNYKWKLPAENKSEGKKIIVKLGVADEQVSSYISLDGDKLANYTWEIAPYKLGTDILDLSGKNGATINYKKLPEWAQEMVTAGTLKLGVAYYSDETATAASQLSEEELGQIKAGREYFVGAFVIGGENGDESKNFTFASDGTWKDRSAAVTYKAPQGALGNIKDAMFKPYFGLPLWAWLAIALAVLLLLIIIIVVACKRRKSKEEREEIKARRQEEKERREEERRLQQERLEQERRLQQEKLEAERELARAKQEAELEKIRAQAGMAAGMASMAMPQQMPQQQMQQQPMPQQMPQQAMPQQQMQSMPQQMPMQAPQQPQQPSAVDSVMLALLQSQATLQAQITEMRATQDASAKAEMELLKMQMLTGNHNNGGYYDAQQAGAKGNPNGLSAELLGEAIVTAFTKLATNSAKPAELPAPDMETASAHAVYPPDAVVTTTTTVDTTQKQPRRGARDDEFADVDGFYDSID